MHPSLNRNFMQASTYASNGRANIIGQVGLRACAFDLLQVCDKAVVMNFINFMRLPNTAFTYSMLFVAALNHIIVQLYS